MLRRIYSRITVLEALLVALTLGLAPFLPVPHVWEKLLMLLAGELTRPVDVFDLVLHGAPWLLLAAKIWQKRAA